MERTELTNAEQQNEIQSTKSSKKFWTWAESAEQACTKRLREWTSYKYGHLDEGPPLVVAAPLVPVGAGGRELRGAHHVNAAVLTHQKILSRNKYCVLQKNGGKVEWIHEIHPSQNP